jgi:signal transduction histidine kinase
MTLRTRLLVTTLLVAAPLAATLFVIAERARHSDMQASIDNALDTEGCAPGGQGPARRGPGEGGPPRGRGRGQRAPLEVHPYTDTFVSARPDGRGPEFPAELRAALATADRASVVWSTPEGRGLQTAVRLAVGSAPCQILLARMRPRPGELRDQLIGLGAVVVVVMLAVTIAAGPTVARIHRLSEAVRASTARGKDTDIPIAGSDEVASLAAAFNNARRDVRTHLTEVEARERTLREFVANTTHDVAVPLTVLQTHLSALENRALDADATSHVRDAMREAHYMGSLLRNLAAASRLDGGVPIDARPLDLAALVERVVARHQPLARASGVDLNMAIPSLPTVVHADATLAEQAVGNLVDNAIRYNHRGGHVAVVLDHSPASDVVSRFVLRVSDDGAGVKPEELPRLATRRFRGDDARSRRPEGQGLGLAIVSEAAGAFGWQLELKTNTPTGLVAELRGPSTKTQTKS